MNIDTTYNFLFHPFSTNYSADKIAMSIAANVALTVLTGGLYLIAFGIIQLKDGFKPTHILPTNDPTPANRINRIGNNRIPVRTPQEPRSGFIGIKGF